MYENIIIRTGTENDKSAFVRLNLEFMQEVMGANPYWMGLAQPSTEEMGRLFLEALAKPEKIHIFIAELNGEIIGYANTWTVFSIWSGGLALTVDDLYIASPYRGSGIGEKVLQYVISFAETHHCKRIQLHAEPSNHKAHDLYKRLQFQEEEMLFFMKIL